MTSTADIDVAVQEAAAILRRGELVAFPTETVYGLGADAENLEAVRDRLACAAQAELDPWR